MTDEQRDVQEYLARIRKTIEKSDALVSQVELRIAETDRMLERQGLSREQVMNMHFSEAQIEAANAELKRRGLDPLELWAGKDGPDNDHASLRERDEPESPEFGVLSSESGGELEARQRKFGMMMKPFHI